MKTMLLVYMVVYGVAFTLLTLAETVFVAEDERDPLWETIVDVVMLALGFVGMALYYRGIEAGHLKMIWKVVAPLLILGQLVMFIRYLRRRPGYVDDGELSEKEISALEIGLTLFLVPSLGVNLLYGFS